MIQSLSSWLAEALARDDATGRLAKLVVAHVVKGNRIGDELRTIKVPEEPDDEWAVATANRITDAAQSEASALGGAVQRYAILAHYEGSDRPAGRYVLTCQGDADPGDVTTEAPDRDGLVSQAMRHTEFFAALAGKQHLAQTKSLQEDNSALRREIEQLRAERVKSYKVLDELYTARADRELEAERERMKNKAIGDVVEKVQLLVPLAINHMAGKKIFPESVTQTLLARSAFESLSREQWTQLGTVLRPEQLAALVQLATSMSKPADDGAGKPGDAGAAIATTGNGTGAHA